MDKMRKVRLVREGFSHDDGFIIELPASVIDETSVIDVDGVVYRYRYSSPISGPIFTEARVLTLGSSDFPFSKLDKRPRITLTATGDQGIGKSLILRDIQDALRVLGFETRLDENEHCLEIIAEDVASKCGSVG